jgi:hypothetical protein
MKTTTNNDDYEETDYIDNGSDQKMKTKKEKV